MSLFFFNPPLPLIICLLVPISLYSHCNVRTNVLNVNYSNVNVRGMMYIYIFARFYVLIQREEHGWNPIRL